MDDMPPITFYFVRYAQAWWKLVLGDEDPS
jgi:hypothetical protein